MTKPPWYYGGLIAAILPLYRLFVSKRSAKLPTHQRELDERFGRAYLPVPAKGGKLIWCHAVSLGELNTAYPLLQLLINAGFGLWITSTTQTGFHRAAVLFDGQLGKTVNHSFVPVDKARIVAEFLAHTNPVMALFVETELWATTLFELKKRQIPSVMVNARLSHQSFLAYQRFAKISQSMMHNLSYVIAQDDQSAEYFKKLGATDDKVCVLDSLKWSSSYAPSQANQELLGAITTSQRWRLSRPIWVAGSTHAEEERLLIGVHRQLLRAYPDAVLIVVPRHPERFDEVAALCQGFITHRRSLGQVIDDDTQIYLADSMGELFVWYDLADVVFVGGSLVDVGGHNPIEPASLGKPIIMGQYVKNCVMLVRALAQVSALVQVADERALLQQITWLLDNPLLAKTQGEQGKLLVAQKQNTAQTHCEKILRLR